MATQENKLHSILANDVDLQEIVQLFVDEMPGRIEKMLEEFELKNWAELRQLAHQLKGSAGSYGFSEISPVASELETALSTNMPEAQIAQTLASLISLCKRTTAESNQE